MLEQKGFDVWEYLTSGIIGGHLTPGHFGDLKAGCDYADRFEEIETDNGIELYAVIENAKIVPTKTGITFTRI